MDPLKLRFTTAHSSSNTPKNVIKRTTVQTLMEILQISHLAPPNYILFYEMLTISIVELETKKFFKVTWLGSTVKEEVYWRYHLQFFFHIRKKLT